MANAEPATSQDGDWPGNVVPFIETVADTSRLGAALDTAPGTKLPHDEPHKSSIDASQRGQKMFKAERHRLQAELNASVEKVAALQAHLFESEQEHTHMMQTKEEESEYRLRKWKESSVALNKLLAQQGAGVRQTTDDELIQKTSTLQWNIRNFTARWFEGVTATDSQVLPLEKFCNQYRIAWSNFHNECLNSPTELPLLIEGIIWEILTMEVFGEYTWLGDLCSDAMLTMSHALVSAHTHTGAPNAEPLMANEKCQKWRATTVNLLLEPTDEAEASGPAKPSHRCSELVRDLYRALMPLAVSKSVLVKPQLSRLFIEAEQLDKTISRQAAGIAWQSRELGCLFRPELMESHAGQTGERVTGSQVGLVLTPAMVKCGRSTGEDYETRTHLLKAQVLRFDPRPTDPVRHSAIEEIAQRREKGRSKEALPKSSRVKGGMSRPKVNVWRKSRLAGYEIVEKEDRRRRESDVKESRGERQRSRNRRYGKKEEQRRLSASLVE